MKLAVEKYFVALKDMQDHISDVLSDWVTPQDQLIEKAQVGLENKSSELSMASLELVVPD